MGRKIISFSKLDLMVVFSLAIIVKFIRKIIPALKSILGFTFNGIKIAFLVIYLSLRRMFSLR
jgi:hypothetical protein